MAAEKGSAAAAVAPAEKLAAAETAVAAEVAAVVAAVAATPRARCRTLSWTLRHAAGLCVSADLLNIVITSACACV